ncbi:MAG: hypothetical protein QOJ75_2189 [Chloroflexota bacterium]|nr:hypothetical protein [Chloroflexota bacterium]
MKVSRTASRRRPSVASRMTTMVSWGASAMEDPLLTGYVAISTHRSASAMVRSSTGPPSVPRAGAMPSGSWSCARMS